MTDRDALLAAVVAAPADDTPRLVFADWLDEHGDAAGPPWAAAPGARAAFIRAQVEAARHDPHAPDGRAAAARAAALLKPLKAVWAAPLRGLILGCGFGRGFVEHVDVDAAAYPAVAAGLFAAEPVRSVKVTRFRLAGGRGELEPVLAVPENGKVEDLDVSSQGLTGAELKAVFRAGPLANLRRLALRRAAAGADDLTAALASDRLPKLDALDLRDTPALAAAVWERCPHRRFRSLDLSRTGLAAADVAALVATPCVEGLEELRLATGPNAPSDGADVAAILADAPALANLRVLDLTGRMIGDDGAVRLAASPHLANLRVLDLAANGLGTTAAVALRDRPDWELFALNLKFNAVGYADVLYLRRRYPLAAVDG